MPVCNLPRSKEIIKVSDNCEAQESSEESIRVFFNGDDNSTTIQASCKKQSKETGLKTKGFQHGWKNGQNKENWNGEGSPPDSLPTLNAWNSNLLSGVKPINLDREFKEQITNTNSYIRVTDTS